MNYGQPDARDRITQALMEVQNPSPRPEMPPMPGQGMNMPAVATPGTVAGMNAQSPASPSFAGAQAPMSAPPMMGAGASPPVMPAPGSQPHAPMPGVAPPPVRY